MFANAGISLRAATAGLLCLILSEAAPAAPVKVGRALVTFYWVVDESAPKYRGDVSAVLRDPRGRVIARTHRQFKLDLVRQGSGWLRDGRTGENGPLSSLSAVLKLGITRGLTAHRSREDRRRLRWHRAVSLRNGISVQTTEVTYSHDEPPQLSFVAVMQGGCDGAHDRV
ncbi:MAG TPA: hypothetical protein VEK57_12720 [Thermoanaerobaculia bacterium]|nr:hypothetical protein [Thermoanaerobaculia bacterium]